jgi:hypothetical protein
MSNSITGNSGSISINGSTGNYLSIDPGSSSIQITPPSGYTWNGFVGIPKVKLQHLEVKKELHAFVIGPLFQKYLKEEGVTTLLVKTVRKLVTDYVDPNVVYLPRYVIPRLVGDELILESPSLDKLLSEDIPFSPEAYLFSHFIMVPVDKREKFIKHLDDKLIELALEGPDDD